MLPRPDLRGPDGTFSTANKNLYDQQVWNPSYGRVARHFTLLSRNRDGTTNPDKLRKNKEKLQATLFETFFCLIISFYCQEWVAEVAQLTDTASVLRALRRLPSSILSICAQCILASSLTEAMLCLSLEIIAPRILSLRPHRIRTKSQLPHSEQLYIHTHISSRSFCLSDFIIVKSRRLENHD